MLNNNANVLCTCAHCSFGAYVQHGEVMATLPKDMEIEDVTLEQVDARAAWELWGQEQNGSGGGMYGSGRHLGGICTAAWFSPLKIEEAVDLL